MGDGKNVTLSLNIQNGLLLDFGRYKGKMLKWKILDELKDSPDGKILVLATAPVGEMAVGGSYKNAPDDTYYYETTTWLFSEAAKWLNDEFAGSAFSEAEMERIANLSPIQQVALHCRLFALNEKQVLDFFPENENRAFGVKWWIDDMVRGKEYTYDDLYMQTVEPDGSIGRCRGDHACCILPAMYVSRYSRDEREEHIREAEETLHRQIREIRDLLESLKKSIPENEALKMRQLEAAVERAQANVTAKKESVSDLEKKAKKAFDTKIHLNSDLHEAYSNLRALGYLKFSAKKKTRAQIAELEEKIQAGEDTYEKLEQDVKEAKNAFYEAIHAVTNAEQEVKQFYQCLLDGELVRKDQELQDIEKKLESIPSLRKEYGF